MADETPSAILIPHALLTALLIFVHLLSLIIATRLLPELEAYLSNPELSVPQPMTKDYHWPVQFVWYLSNVVGVFLFLMQLVFVAYVKFYPKNPMEKNRVHVGTATLAFVSLMLIVSLPFIVNFFRTLSKQKIKHYKEELVQAHDLVENMNQSSIIMESNI